MIRLENLEKTYKTKADSNEVLRDITIEFPDKGFFAIVGDSGSGKTTLLNILGGLDRDYQGKYFFDGKEVKDFDDRAMDDFRNREIGFVFQDFVLVDELSVRDNILLSCQEEDEKKAEAKVDDLLRSLGLASLSKRKASLLSGGEKQRVAILRALVNSPRIVLADEPTGSLDSRNSLLIADLLKKISKDRLVIMVTHNTALAKSHADHILTMEDGRICSSDAIAVPEREEESITEEKKPFRLAFKKILRLSTSFLLAKKIKTFLTALGSSFSIFGLTLILALFSGFSVYVDDLETKTLREFPLTVEEVALPTTTLTQIDESLQNYLDNEEDVFLSDSVNPFYTTNAIDESFVKDMENLDPSLYTDMSMRTGLSFHLLAKGNQSGSLFTYSQSRTSLLESTFANTVHLSELPSFQEEIEDQYDIHGSYPQGKGEMALVIGNDNRVSQALLQAIGIESTGLDEDGNNKISFSTILEHEMKVVPNDDFYIDITDPYNPIEATGIFLERQYELQNQSLSLNDLLGKALETDFSLEAMDKETLEVFLSYVEVPDYALPLEEVDFDDPNSVEDFFLSLFQTKRLKLFREMNEEEKEDYLLDSDKGFSIKITAILKPKKGAFLPSLSSGLYYTKEFADSVEKASSARFVDENGNGRIDASEDRRCAIAKSYEDNLYLTFDGQVHLVTCSILDSPTLSSDPLTYLSNRKLFGVDNAIASITIFPKDYKAKEKILDYIDSCNERRIQEGKKALTPTDIVGMIFSNLDMVLDIVFLILILFTSISLVVTVVLIASILYASVLEKTKEIGLFRALGFSKKDVFLIFALMSLLLGLLSGILGVLLGFFATFGVNVLATSLFPSFGVDHIAFLPIYLPFLLILLSLLLSFLSALVPSLVAAKRDPVLSLRNE